MKLNVNRETTIGLSVLLVLLVILGVVAAQRFLRPNRFHEATARAEEEKPAEALFADMAKHKRDSCPKPALLTPVEKPNRDPLRSLDDPDHWNTAAREMRTETPASSAASRPSADRPTARSNSMVVQVSGGEQADGAPRALDRNAAGEHRPKLTPRPEEEAPRTLDRYAAENPAPAIQPVQPGPGMVGDIVGPAREETRHHAPREASVAEMQVAPSAPQSTYQAGPPPRAPTARYSYDATSPPPADPMPRTYASAPGDGPSTYGAVPAGYGQDNAARPGREDPDHIPGRNPPTTSTWRPGDGTYEVQPNDSYWTISERVYGSGGYFRALAERNRGKAARPDRLPPGLVISTPPVSQLEKDYPDLCPRPNRRETVRERAAGVSMAATAGGGRTYIVQEGDTLSSIARNELGKVSRWAEVYQLNREALGKDYDYLTPGMRLVLPIRDARSDDRTTRRAEGDAPLMR